MYPYSLLCPKGVGKTDSSASYFVGNSPPLVESPTEGESEVITDSKIERENELFSYPIFMQQHNSELFCIIIMIFSFST